MKKFITTVLSEGNQIMYAYTDTREEGVAKALDYIALFDSKAVPYLKDSLVINQKPNQ